MEGALPVGPERPPLIAGVEGRLLSCTVSSAGPFPLEPRTGVLIPDLTGRSSSPASESVERVELRVGRSTTTKGVVGADWVWSIFRGVVKPGLLAPDDAAGGGELRRGIFNPEPAVGALLAF